MNKILKKIIYISVIITAVFTVFFIFSNNAEAATRTIADGGGNYNATATWVEGVVPTSADDVVATATSGQLTVNTASAAKTFIMTNYTNTLTMNATLTVSGDLTLVAAMTLAGSGYFSLNATATLTSNGKSVPNLQFIGTSITYTLADNWTVTSTLNLGGTTSQVINGNTIYVSGNFTDSMATTGTTTIIMNGTGTWTGSQYLHLDMEINTTGTITFAGSGNFTRKGNGTFTYTAGTIIDTGITLAFYPTTSATLALSGRTWNSIYFGAATKTFTLTNDITATTIILAGTGAPVINGQTIYTANLTSTTTGTTTGTTNIVMNGTGTWSNSSTGALRNNLTFNTAGTITISGNVYYNTGTLTYTAGTITTTGSTLNMSASTTLNTNGMSWNNVIATTSGAIYTLTSNMDVDGNMQVGGGVGSTTINGSTVTVGGNLSLLGSTSGGGINGTTNFIMDGTGTLSTNAVGTSGNNLTGGITINTAGTITLGTFIFATTYTGTFSYVAGTVVATDTVYVGTGTFDFNGITLNNFSISRLAAAIVTLPSGFKIAGTFTNTNSLQTIKSSVVGTQRTLSMLAGSSQSLTGLSPTDIDSSGGYPVITSGTIANSPNWYASSPDKFFLLF